MAEPHMLSATAVSAHHEEESASVSSPSTTPRASAQDDVYAATRLFNIAELVEQILLAATSDTRDNNIADAIALSWIFQIQRVNKCCALTVRHSSRLQQAMFLSFAPDGDRPILKNPLLRCAWFPHSLEKMSSNYDPHDIFLYFSTSESKWKVLADWARSAQNTVWAKMKCTDRPYRMHVRLFPNGPWSAGQRPWPHCKDLTGSQLDNPTLGKVVLRIAEYYDLVYPPKRELRSGLR